MSKVDQQTCGQEGQQIDQQAYQQVCQPANEDKKGAGMTTDSIKKHDTKADAYTDGIINSYVLDAEAADRLLTKISGEYRIFAPSNSRGSRYSEIYSFADIANDKPSDFSFKEVIFPVRQTIFYFIDGNAEESQLADERKLLIIMHPCDFHALKKLDEIYLHQGSTKDPYYARLREKIVPALIECPETCENGFCVSMGTNTTDEWKIAIRIKDSGRVLLAVKDQELDEYFKSESDACCDEEHSKCAGIEKESSMDSREEHSNRSGTDPKTESVSEPGSDPKKDHFFEPEFVHENSKKLELPLIKSEEEAVKASRLAFWSENDDVCLSCGTCNTVCPTCSCFDTKDIWYDDTFKNGERQRIWAGCMNEDFSLIAGGIRMRRSPGENHRYRVLHKLYYFGARMAAQSGASAGTDRYDSRADERTGAPAAGTGTGAPAATCRNEAGTPEHAMMQTMCVGCGRCISACPKDISIIELAKRCREELGT